MKVILDVGWNEMKIVIIIIASCVAVGCGSLSHQRHSNSISHAALAKVVTRGGEKTFEIQEMWLGKRSDIHKNQLAARSYALVCPVPKRNKWW